MTTFGILLRNEALKTYKRFAFLVAAGSFFGLVAIGFTNQLLRARANPARPFALPAAWNDIVSEPGQVSLFFCAAALMLLLGSEFTWRTARQNVIDGLSKNQWFAGKLILLVMVALTFLLINTGVGGILALAGTPAGSQLLPAPQLKLLGGYALGLLGFSSLALFFGFLARSAGPGLAMFFLYVAMLERGLGMGLRQISDSLSAVATWLPVSVFMELIQASQWDPAVLQEEIAAAIANGAPPPMAMNGTHLVLAGAGWIVVLLLAAYATFRSRDL